MSKKSSYSGYKSFQYLDERKDYKYFELASEVHRVEPHEISLSENENNRADRILQNFIVISLHDHPVVLPRDITKIFDYQREGRHRTAYEGLSLSNLDAVFDNLMNGIATITSKKGWKWRDVIYDLGMRLSDLAHQDFVTRCEKIQDIITAHEEEKIALVPALESSTMIENEVDRIDILYGLGIRMMGIVYSESNALGSGLKEKRDGGLTYFGREAVNRMNKIGMAIDISHAGDQTSLDVIEASKKPVFITHAGARELWNSRRLKPDIVLKACAAEGGVIGIEAAPHTTLTKEHPEHSIDSVMDHFEYCVDLVGIDHVGFGPDTLFGDHVGVHEAYSQHLSTQQAFVSQESEEAKSVEYVKGMENPAEASTNIVRWLVKRRYSDAEIEKVIGGNALRVLKEVW